MSNYYEDENGFVIIKNNPITKSGVFQYLGKSIDSSLEPDKIYNVWRPEEEVNNPETIESFKLSPWIPEHVMLGKEFTPAESVGVQGVTGETIEFKNGTLFSTLKLFGEKLKEAIKGGLKELSCGFRCSWEIKSGVTPGGESYDVIQRDIRGNHIASVQNGRMGSDVRVAMDRAVFALDSIDFNEEGEINMDEELKKILDAITALTEKVNAIESKVNESGEPSEDEKDEGAKDEAKEGKVADQEPSELVTEVETLKKDVETLKAAAMDGKELVKQVMKEASEKSTLVESAQRMVGVFDHSEMDTCAVAKYTLEKLGVACDSGEEVAMLKGIVLARKQPTFTVDKGNAFDSKDQAKAPDSISKMGL